MPDSLFINWDQTGCQMVPGGEWTMDERGSTQVTIAGLYDKRQITVLLAAAKDGTLLPPQVIYAGKSDRCLPKGVRFPNDWDVTHTESHWSNEDSMIRYVEKVIVPYVNSIRDTLPLSQCDQQAILKRNKKKRQNPKTLIKDLVMKRVEDMNQLRERNASQTGVQIKMEKRQINLHLQHKDSLV